MVVAEPLDRRARGALVEAAARRHLLDAGLRQLAANVNYRIGELDLVMLDRDRDGDVVVFVEVRYRADANFGGGAASVDHRKRRKLLRAAAMFLLRTRRNDASCRFDVIEASGDPVRPRLHWIRDAFRADD
ncbi:MAG: YraN family protein [Luteimonas sp.]